MSNTHRPTWHQIHMKQAELMALRSSCVKLKVGAVIVKDNRSISQGYNGVGPKCRHCVDYWRDFYEFNKFVNSLDEPLELKHDNFESFIQSQAFRAAHKTWSVQNELHAEQNCILWAAREGISTKNTTLYTIYSPCINCAKVIHTAGISEVYYKNIYESDKSGIEYLQKNNIICVNI
jgi:dCMP deaminase